MVNIVKSSTRDLWVYILMYKKLKDTKGVEGPFKVIYCPSLHSRLFHISLSWSSKLDHLVFKISSPFFSLSYLVKMFVAWLRRRIRRKEEEERVCVYIESRSGGCGFIGVPSFPSPLPLLCLALLLFICKPLFQYL